MTVKAKHRRKERPKKPVLTFLRRQQVTAFYTLLRDGAYDGRDEEREAVEQMFITASNAGLIK